MGIFKKKEPKQSRSKETVDTILQAVAELTSKGHGEELTTTTIAERAGVSIGSVYQYFPSKSSIFSALIDRYMQKELEFIRTSFIEFEKLPFETALSNVVDAIFEMRKRNVVLEHTLLNFFSRYGNVDFIIQNDAALVKEVERAFERAASSGRLQNIHLSAFIIAHAVRSVFFAATLQKRELYQSDDLPRELKRFLVAYLRSEPSPRP